MSNPLRLFLEQLVESDDRAPVVEVRRAAWQRREAYSHEPSRPGIDPTRYGDWEYNGRCTDFF